MKRVYHRHAVLVLGMHHTATDAGLAELVEKIIVAVVQRAFVGDNHCELVGICGRLLSETVMLSFQHRRERALRLRLGLLLVIEQSSTKKTKVQEQIETAGRSRTSNAK